MKHVVTGSIAFDYLMSFPGKFTDHFLPEHMHRVSLSFLVDTMDKRRGGCAPNIAYTLALLGERPLLMATAGQDFGDYRAWLEAAGIDTSYVKMIDGKFSASFFCSTDQENNQIASFYTGAMANAAELSFRSVAGLGRDDLVIISPNDPDAMVQYAQECSALGIPYIWDPGQQCARMDGPQLAEGVSGAFVVIVNDYEFELLRQKTGDGRGRDPATGAGARRHARRAGCTVLSEGRPSRRARGAAGAHRRSDGRRRRIPRRIHERAGGRGAYEVCARLGSVAATYALEHLGGTSHAYTRHQFAAGTRSTSVRSLRCRCAAPAVFGWRARLQVRACARCFARAAGAPRLARLSGCRCVRAWVRAQLQVRALARRSPLQERRRTAFGTPPFQPSTPHLDETARAERPELLQTRAQASGEPAARAKR